MTDLEAMIGGLYAQVGAPAWAAPNLDGLADVLRDLSWRPAGRVRLDLPDLRELDLDDAVRLMRVLVGAEVGTADGPRPVQLSAGPPGAAHT